MKYWNQFDLPVVSVCNSNKLKRSMLDERNFAKDSNLYYASKFQTFDDVGVSVVEDKLQSIEDNGYIDRQDPGEGCGNTFNVDWRSDTSIIQRLEQVGKRAWLGTPFVICPISK